MKKDRPSVSLRLKLTIVVLLVSVLPLGIVGYALIGAKTEALREANQELLFAVVADVSRSIESALGETQDRLDAVGNALTNRDYSSDMRIALATELVGSAESLLRVAIYDGEGKTIDVIGEKSESAAAAAELTPPVNLDPALRATAIEKGRAVARPSIVMGAPRALVVVPIEGPGATWFCATYASLEPIQERVTRLANERFHGDLSSVIVIDSYFRAIAHPNAELADTLTPMHEHGLLKDIEGGRLPPSLLVFRADVDSGTESVAAVLVSVDQLGWGVIAQVPTDRAFRSLAAMRKLVIIVMGFVMLLAAAAAVFFAHRLTDPIRKLVGFTKDLAQRRFDKRVTIHTRDELSVLGQALSTAAMDLEESEREIKEQVEIRSNLGRYLPAQLVDRIVKHQQSLELGGERREITVLFADVAGFTPLAESHSADEVVTILNELFTILTEIVFRHDGTVDKFIGDCVMAFWGAPDPQPDHAARALRAAEDMLRFLEVGNKAWEEKYGVTIRLAIGVHSGDAVVGNFGSATRMEYTAVGDVVNLASHLEAVARPQQIVVSEATRKAAGEGFDYLDLGERELPGHERAKRLFEVRL